MEGNLELPRPSHNLICIVSGHGTCSELHTQAVREVEKVDAEHESVRHIVTCDHIQWQLQCWCPGQDQWSEGAATLGI